MAELTIVALERARLKGWFEIEINGKPPFLIDEETIFKHALKAGDNISESDFKKIRDAADLAWLKNKAMQILSRRMISERDLRRKLSAERKSQALRDEAIEQLKQCGLLNDVQFAASYVRSQLSQGPKSRLYLKKKLWEKGISAETAAQAMNAELEGIDELAAVKELAAKKYKTLRHLPAEKSRMRLVNFLRGKGFSWDIIRSAIAGLASDEREEP